MSTPLGLPSSMRARKEAIDKEEETNKGIESEETNTELDQGDESAPMAESTPELASESAPASEPAPTPVPSPSDYAKLESKMDRLAERLSQVLDENERLRNAQNKPVDKHEPEPEPEPEYEDLTPEEKKLFSQSLPTIEKVARRLAAEMAQPLKNEIKTLREQVATSQSSYANMNEEMFVATIRKEIPDMDSKLNAPGWKEYVGSTIPRTNLTVGQALINAHKARKLQTIQEIFESFKLEGASKLSAQAMPSTVKASTAPKPVEKLKFSDRQKLSEDFRKGRISKERFDTLVAKYDRAELEGRVNFDS